MFAAASRRLICASLLFTSLAHALPLQTQLPDLGEAADDTLSIQDERKVATEVVRALRRSNEVIDDPDFSDYLNNLGYRLVASSQNSSLSFDFYPVLNPSVNAAAYPGGVVIVHSGLILLAKTEDELAAVLAHEIAHVTQRHLARLAHATRGDSAGALLAIALAIFAASKGSDAGAMASIAGFQGAVAQHQLNYTREFEREADRVGMDTLASAGFDSHAMPQFFSQLERHNRLVDNNAYTFLRTHPVTTERISDSEARAAQAPYRPKSGNLTFELLREKARVLQMGRESLDWYAATLKERRFGNEAVARYGYALALVQYGELEKAGQEMAWLKNRLGAQVLLVRLEGDRLLALGKPVEAQKLFERARSRYPAARSLLYGEIEAARQAGKPQEALQIAQSELAVRRSDAGLYRLQAAAYADLGKPALQHQTLAEYYVLNQETPLAIEQLELARKDAGDDFYLQSALEARLQQLRQGL